MAPVDNTEHLVANALRSNFPTHPGVPSTRNWVKHHGLGPLPRQANNIAVDAAREALEQANEEDAFVAYYPNRYNPPTNGLFLLRTGGRVFSGHWWQNDDRVFYQLDL